MSALKLSSRVKLSDGFTMPLFGLGVYQMGGSTCYNAVMAALEAGYRLIDSAEWYGNEADCGRAINDFVKSNKAAREDIFYTTKIQNNSTEAHALSTIDKSLRLAKLDYIDLFLIHSPYPSKAARIDTWRGLQKAVDQGKVRSIGVSNWGKRHLEELFADESCKIKPALNQIDLHPFMRRFKEVEYNKQHDIKLMAWAPLVEGQKFEHPVIKRVAQKHQKSPAQVLLRWGLQQSFIVVPKSERPERIQENAQIYDFELDEEDMEELDGLDEHFVTDWDPIGR